MHIILCYVLHVYVNELDPETQMHYHAPWVYTAAAP